ncbi:glycerate kinase family protein [Parasphingorhabdus pacifica]
MRRFVIAPAGFKECLDADAVAAAIATGIRRVVPAAVVDAIPLIDGGEGSARSMAAETGGELVPVEVTGPLGQPVKSHFALLGGSGPRIAYVEMAAAAGLSLVPPGQRDPGRTTSRGVGELIATALGTGPKQIVVGCGDSGICDGGAGALRALGARVLDSSGRDLEPGGAGLIRAHRIDTAELDHRLHQVELLVATNPDNVLCGPRGVARTYAPQKGATPKQVELLAEAMHEWAGVLREHSGLDLRHARGSGASGGLGAGLAGVLGGRLVPRFEVLSDWSVWEHRLAAADLVITAEGAIDSSTACGKAPSEVAKRAKKHGKPVIAFAGTIGAGAENSYETGIDAFTGILNGPVELAAAIDQAPELIASATARTLRMLLVGRSLATVT